MKQYHRKNSITNLCLFLKLLFEDTSKDFKIIKMKEVAHSFNVPYSSDICGILKEKGILVSKAVKGTKGVRMYKWTSTTEPNHLMAEAILDEVGQNHNKCKQKSIIKTNSTEEIIIDSVLEKTFGLNLNKVAQTLKELSTTTVYGTNGNIIIKGKIESIDIRNNLFWIDGIQCNKIATTLIDFAKEF